ncbi:hypothetical protein TrVE_jg9252 [Triparma verrucosa]|uniref:Uncharacterized protein n=1 Tax=Triparma verrucosa TaxID=1606542 RepID=A0A9W7BF86_9STRA|nr:hypothetical protein TrVE_jg9252 [Triparma verrucosa]
MLSRFPPRIIRGGIKKRSWLLSRRWYNDDDSPPLESPENFLLFATAKQLKGDIPEATALASKALSWNRKNDTSAIADNVLFLGKLHQLQENFEEAETFFTEAYDLTKTSSSPSRDECNALTHLAYVQHKLKRFTSAEASYKSAIEGLSETVGWSDGATNRAGFELVQFYRQQNRQDDAIKTLKLMQTALSKIFGSTDTKVLQLNIEMAAILTSSSSNATNRLKAISLLKGVCDILPPNEPEARRAFIKLEELKEDVNSHRNSSS